MRKSPPIRWMSLLAVLMLVLGACSSGSDEAVSSITVEAESFGFSPSSVKVLADTDISITLKNTSSIDEHEWVIVKLGSEISSEAEFNEDVVLWEVEKQAPGTTVTETFNVPAGEYQIICALDGHYAGGMHGTMSVVDG